MRGYPDRDRTYQKKKPSAGAIPSPSRPPSTNAQTPRCPDEEVPKRGVGFARAKRSQKNMRGEPLVFHPFGNQNGSCAALTQKSSCKEQHLKVGSGRGREQRERGGESHGCIALETWPGGRSPHSASRRSVVATGCVGGPKNLSAAGEAPVKTRLRIQTPVSVRRYSEGRPDRGEAACWILCCTKPFCLVLFFFLLLGAGPCPSSCSPFPLELLTTAQHVIKRATTTSRGVDIKVAAVVLTLLSANNQSKPCCANYTRTDGNFLAGS